MSSRVFLNALRFTECSRFIGIIPITHNYGDTPRYIIREYLFFLLIIITYLFYSAEQQCTQIAQRVYDFVTVYV